MLLMQIIYSAREGHTMHNNPVAEALKKVLADS
jgi:hypothetical protein